MKGISIITQTERWHKRLRRVLAGRGKDPTGLKRMYVPGDGDGFVLTPWGRKELRRRERARKIAHESRRMNARRP